MDFTGQLENMIREAALHIKNKFKDDNTQEMPNGTVFLFMGIMLMSEKLKAWAPNVYLDLVKTMDNLYTAGGIASDAQIYLDHGIKTDNKTNHNSIAYYMHRPQ